MISIAPKTEQELMRRAQDLAGRRVAEVAQRLGTTAPQRLTQHKGWLGHCLETVLGADAGNEAEPHFVDLQIECKTIPINAQGKPLETTFVCAIPLLHIAKETWSTSTVYRKCRRVLWIPIVCEANQSVADRFVWQANVNQLACLQQDWCELTDMICMGQLAAIHASLGEALHIRPKGANAKSLTWAIGPDGNKIQTCPRGFYLRTQFTAAILAEQFAAG